MESTYVLRDYACEFIAHRSALSLKYTEPVDRTELTIDSEDIRMRHAATHPAAKALRTPGFGGSSQNLAPPNFFKRICERVQGIPSRILSKGIEESLGRPAVNEADSG